MATAKLGMGKFSSLIWKIASEYGRVNVGVGDLMPGLLHSGENAARSSEEVD